MRRPSLVCLSLAAACSPARVDLPEPTTGLALDDTAAAAPCEAPSLTDDVRFDALLDRLDATLDPDPAAAAPSGIAVAVVLDGQVHAAGAVGHLAKSGAPGADEPVTVDTRFPIASTSKWVTATAAMALVDAGRIDPHAPVTTLLPTYTEANGQQDHITLHHLLRMRSGLANDGGCWLYSESAQEVPDGCAAFTGGPDTVLGELFRPAVLASPPYDGSLGAYNITTGVPGEADYLYSDWGYMLAGRLLERADDGRAFEAVVAERVFEPACMQTATYDPAVAAAEPPPLGGGPASVDGYCPEPELGHDSVQPFFPDALACPARNPNGGVRATAVDLARFAETLLADLSGANRMLSPDAAAALLCPEGGSPGADCAGRVAVTLPHASTYGDTYGYANFRDMHGGREVYNHGGGRAGFGALFWVVPSEGFAVVMLGNDDGGSVDLQPAARFAMDCFLDGAC